MSARNVFYKRQYFLINSPRADNWLWSVKSLDNDKPVFCKVVNKILCMADFSTESLISVEISLCTQNSTVKVLNQV